MIFSYSFASPQACGVRRMVAASAPHFAYIYLWVEARLASQAKEASNCNRLHRKDQTEAHV